ncbi:MAG: sensor histidine kinase [Bacteroidota bacterium]|nr:sensor histidine kinase [Bacteroidota bacterium]
MRKTIVACISFFFVLNSAKTQQRLVDSITKELQQPMADSNRALSMMRLAVDYEMVDTAKAYNAYRDGIKFASEKKLFYHLGRIYQNQSFLFNSSLRYSDCRSSLDTAVINYQKSDHPNAKLWEANAYGDIANVLKLQNETQQSVQYQLKCISLFEQLGLPDKLAIRYCNLSSLFGDLDEYEKSVEYANKALAVSRQTMNKQNLFMSYMSLAHALTGQEKNNEAKINLDSARVYADENSNIDILVTYYLISAQVFRKINKLDSAQFYFQKCYNVSVKYNYGYGKAESLIQMGAVSILQKKYNEAERYLLPGIKQAAEIHYFNMLNDGYKYLSDVYAVTGKYKEAYEYFQKYKGVNDSAVSLESKKFVSQLEKKYESVKKDGQIKLQKVQIQRKNILNYILVGSAVTILLISLLAYRTYSQKQKLQQQRISELETEKQLTATEAVLKGEEQERARLAKDLHDGLGGMLSGIKYSFNTMKGNLIMTPENAQAFERSMDMLDSSIREMRRVAHNMMPEALVKFGLDTALKDFCNDINQSGALVVNYQSIGMENVMLDQTISITIYRIVQELINNTMKHAAAKNAIVQVSKSNGGITITVEDDGKGFNPVILQGAKGIGWSNIQSRVEYLKGRLDVQSAADKGTSVHIELNIT